MYTRLHAIPHREEVGDVIVAIGMVDVDQAELAGPGLGHPNLGARSLSLTYGNL